MTHVHRSWIFAALLVVAPALTGCMATSPKVYPETSWPTLRLSPPAWLQQPTAVIDVLWERTAAPTPEIRGGVCVLRMADEVEANLNPGEEQIAACLRSGQMRLQPAPPPGAVRLHWHREAGISGVMAKLHQLFHTSSYPLAGFYYHPNPAGPCHVVTSIAHEALGHEIKHCFDGSFHAAGNRWLAHGSSTNYRGFYGK
ncbi:MAG TPA: hypothetical protein VIL30_26900 [Ramlibacter sp.]|jgi:hypothetical protein